MTVYDAVGGDATFERIVALFYAGVERDSLLRHRSSLKSEATLPCGIVSRSIPTISARPSTT